LGTAGAGRCCLPRCRTGERRGKLTSVLIYLHEYPPEVEKQLRAEAKRFREPLPERVKNKPELYWGNALFLNAWFELDTERNRSEYQPITRSMCFQYAYDYDLDWEQTEDLWFYIDRMDREFLQWFKKRQPKPRVKEPRGKGGSKPSRSR
jgi:hypothetical protein